MRHLELCAIDQLVSPIMGRSRCPGPAQEFRGPWGTSQAASSGRVSSAARTPGSVLTNGLCKIVPFRSNIFPSLTLELILVTFMGNNSYTVYGSRIFSMFTFAPSPQSVVEYFHPPQKKPCISSHSHLSLALSLGTHTNLPASVDLPILDLRVNGIAYCM